MPDAPRLHETMRHVDCLVVGAGPAGMTAAMYLARFRRSVIVVGHGKSRALKIPLSHNIPGFADGISGPDILKRHEAQLMAHGVVPERGRIETAHALKGGSFRLVLEGEDGGREDVDARTILIATGVNDKEPALADVGAAIRDGLVRICPVCDAYEVRDQDIAVLGDDSGAVGEAVFLRTYSRTVTLLLYGGTKDLADSDRRTLLNAGVGVVEEPVAAVHAEDGKTTLLTIGGAEHRFDTLYSSLGAQSNSDLAVTLGADVEPSCRAIVVDPHQRTTVAGVWGAGDVVISLNQISVSWGHAAIAATDIHNHLRDTSAA